MENKDLEKQLLLIGIAVAKLKEIVDTVIDYHIINAEDVQPDEMLKTPENELPHVCEYCGGTIDLEDYDSTMVHVERINGMVINHVLHVVCIPAYTARNKRKK